jgi:hypothetical protein
MVVRNYAGAGAPFASDIYIHAHQKPSLTYNASTALKDSTPMHLAGMFNIKNGENFSVVVRHNNEYPNTGASLDIGYVDPTYSQSDYFRFGGCTRIAIHELI